MRFNVFKYNTTSLDKTHAGYMAPAFHAHVYVSVNCTGLKMLVLAFWSTVH